MAKIRMKVAFAASLFTASAPVSAQGIAHTWFMRGSIVGIDFRGPVVCIGRVDGAEAGQVLEVYRPAPVYLRRRGSNHYRKKLIAHVAVDQIINDHYAHVTVIDGEPRKGDIVELQRHH